MLNLFVADVSCLQTYSFLCRHRRLMKPSTQSTHAHVQQTKTDCSPLSETMPDCSSLTSTYTFLTSSIQDQYPGLLLHLVVANLDTVSTEHRRTDLEQELLLCWLVHVNLAVINPQGACICRRSHPLVTLITCSVSCNLINNPPWFVTTFE